jgi:uncharacterized protein (TIGR00251 family)
MIQRTREGVVIDIRVIPRASKRGVEGTRDGRLMVRIESPPVDGAANAELIDVLSRALDVPKRLIAVVAGRRSRQKRVRISVADVASLEARLAALQ